MQENPTGLEFGASLPSRLRRRLGFLYEGSEHGEPTTPCRLPGCPGQVEREVRTGRPRWFHDVPKCTKEFRRRREALDEAITELIAQLRSGELTARDNHAVRSQLTWLRNVRATYPAPGDWNLGWSDEPTEGLDLTEVAALGFATHRSTDGHCRTCGGTGALSMRAASIAAVRSYRGALDEVAELLRRHQKAGGSTSSSIPDALAIISREVERVSDLLERMPDR